MTPHAHTLRRINVLAWVSKCLYTLSPDLKRKPRDFTLSISPLGLEMPKKISLWWHPRFSHADRAQIINETPSSSDRDLGQWTHPIHITSMRSQISASFLCLLSGWKWRWRWIEACFVMPIYNDNILSIVFSTYKKWCREIMPIISKALYGMLIAVKFLNTEKVYG